MAKYIKFTEWGKAYLNGDGYWEIVTPFNRKDKRKREHRLTMEKWLNRKLKSNEVVHHIDGNKQNNCVLNLEVMSIEEHIKLHHTGKTLSEEHKQRLREFHSGKVLSEEHKRKISENNAKIMQGHYGSNHVAWKSYARIVKTSGVKNGKQQFAVAFNGKKIKFSYYRDKLVNWFTENYPNEILLIGGG